MKTIVLVLVVLPAVLSVRLDGGYNRRRQFQRQQEPWHSPSSACFQEACDIIKDEVDSLSRLKIVRTYVTETVKLLDSLMGSMDEELVKIATKIKESGAENCPDLPSPLDYIAEPMERDRASAIPLITEDSVELNYGSGQLTVGQNIEVHDDLDELSHGIEQTTDQDTHRSTSTWSSRDWSQHSSMENDVDSNEDGRWGGRTLWGQGGSSTHSPGKGRQLTDAPRGRQTLGDATSTWRPVAGNCRGVRDSPHFVPGIDSWCRDNCSRGYCPPSHCICR